MSDQSITPPPMNPPHTADDCRRWQDLDARFGTTPDSPLHHNNRCTAPEHTPAATLRPVGLLRFTPSIRPTSLPRR